jgi:UDP-N-acetylglucosamine transferase subunit ALG13
MEFSYHYLTINLAIIQYGNTTTKGVTIFTYNMKGELETLDGDFTIEIL